MLGSVPMAHIKLDTEPAHVIQTTIVTTPEALDSTIHLVTDHDGEITVQYCRRKPIDRLDQAQVQEIRLAHL